MNLKKLDFHLKNRANQDTLSHEYHPQQCPFHARFPRSNFRFSRSNAPRIQQMHGNQVFNTSLTEAVSGRQTEVVNVSPTPNPSGSGPIASAKSALEEALSSPSLWKTVGVGAAAGVVAFCLGEPINAIADRPSTDVVGTLTRILAISSSWVAVIGTIIGLALLAWENASSLRGKWFRDMGPGAPLFAFLGLASGAAAQVIYSLGMVAAFAGSGVGRSSMSASVLLVASFIRGIGWALFGAGVGASIGILRGDKGQTKRGALGGAIGGFVGGALFNIISATMSNSDVFPRFVGVVLLGAFIGGAARLVQETMRSAWLLGITTGPYEGKEYSLGKARLTVGRGNNCDLSLFRDESLAPQLGALVFQNNSWWWQGEPIPVNGIPQTNAQLFPGSRLQIGQTTFRFNDRSKNAPRDPLPPPIVPGTSIMSTPSFPSAPSSTPTPIPVSLAATPPVPWTFAPSIGNSLTGFRLSLEVGTATVGRAPGNDWTLNDDGTSSRHARIDRTFDGLAITDLGSTNGTWINGQKLAPHIATSLGGGETIRIGRTQWMLRRGG